MNIISFDFEEWYTYIKYRKGKRSHWEPSLLLYLTEILDLLDTFQTRATFFCLGIIAKTDPDIIKQIANRGHDIGCHSYDHTFIHELTPKSFYNDIAKAINLLEQTTGKKVNMFRAPAFSITAKTNWALDTLIELGIEYDSSIFPSNRRYGGFPEYKTGSPATILTVNGNTIREFPISYTNILGKRLMYSGGGYFRALPYRFIRKTFMTTEYNMSYFHLRDFDHNQKRFINHQYFTNYYGIDGSFKKFKRLIEDFNFISLGEAAESINWESQQLIVLKQG